MDPSFNLQIDGDVSENPESAEEGESAIKSAHGRQKEYWERMSNVIDDKNYRIWTVSDLKYSSQHKLTLMYPY
jgi:hypothetical protein